MDAPHAPVGLVPFEPLPAVEDVEEGAVPPEELPVDEDLGHRVVPRRGAVEVATVWVMGCGIVGCGIVRCGKLYFRGSPCCREFEILLVGKNAMLSL